MLRILLLEGELTELCSPPVALSPIHLPGPNPSTSIDLGAFPEVLVSKSAFDEN